MRSGGRWWSSLWGSQAMSTLGAGKGIGRMHSMLSPHWPQQLGCLTEATHGRWADCRDDIELELEQRRVAVVCSYMDQARQHVMAPATALRLCYAAPSRRYCWSGWRPSLGPWCASSPRCRRSKRSALIAD